MFANPSPNDREEAARRMMLLHDQMVTKYEAELHETRTELAAFRAENHSLLRRLEQGDVEAAKSQTVNAQYVNEIQTLMGRQREMASVVSKLQTELCESNSHRDTLQAMLDDTKTKLLEYENRLLRTESNATIQVELETRITRQNTIINELQREVTMLQETNRTLSLEASTLRKTLSEQHKEKEESELRIAELSARSEGDNGEINRLRSEGVRLREQIQTMARQQVETLNKHLQTVEAKHKKHVNDLKEENSIRINEITALQAKLSKAEWSLSLAERERALSSGNGMLSLTGPGGVTTSSGGSNPITDIIETQQRTINELNMKNGELMLALEKMEINTRKEARQQKLDLEEARTKLEEVSTRAAVHRREVEETRALVDRQSEELSRTYSEVHNLKAQLEESEKKRESDIHSLKRQTLMQEERHRGVVEDLQERLKTLERKHTRYAETSTERESKLKQDMTTTMERLQSEIREIKKAKEEASAISRDAQARSAQLSTLVMDKERENASLEFNVQKLMQGLEAHKVQITSLNDKLVQTSTREQELRQQHHEIFLKCEQYRTQLDVAIKERNVAVADLATLCEMLRSGKSSSRKKH